MRKLHNLHVCYHFIGNMTYMLTTWFGCFRFDENKKLDEYILFSKNEKNISEKLSLISKNQILSEEKKLAKHQSSIHVNQKRLRSLGHYNHPL